MIELGDAAPFQPLRFTRAVLPSAHVYSRVDFLLAASIYRSSLRANGSRECAPDDRFREAIQRDARRLDASSLTLLAVAVSATPENACSASGPAPDSWSRCAGRREYQAAPAFSHTPAGRRSGRARG